MLGGVKGVLHIQRLVKPKPLLQFSANDMTCLRLNNNSRCEIVIVIVERCDIPAANNVFTVYSLQVYMVYHIYRVHHTVYLQSIAYIQNQK